MALTVQSMSNALKKLYDPAQLKNLTYKNNPAYAHIKKANDFEGEDYNVSLIYTDGASRSARLQQSISGGTRTAPRTARFVITRVLDFSSGFVSREVMMASESNKGAAIKALKLLGDGLINQLKRSIAIALYRTGWGNIGNVALGSAVNTVNLQLANPADAVNFEVDQELVAFEFESTGNIRPVGSSGFGLIITGIDRQSGKLTFGAAINDATDGIPTIAPGDYLAVRGDREEVSNPTRLKMTGFQSYLANTEAEAQTALWGQARSSDTQRLAGTRFDGSALPVRDALIEAVSEINQFGGNPDIIFIGYEKYTALVISLQSEVVRYELKVTQDISFKGVTLQTRIGEIGVIPDMNCPSDRAFALQSDTWCLHTLGEAIDLVDDDGLKLIRVTTGSQIQYMMNFSFMGNLACNAPGFNGNIYLGNQQ